MSGQADALSDFQLVQFLGYMRIPAKTENTERLRELFGINKKQNNGMIILEFVS